jgi:hypothetical protein
LEISQQERRPIDPMNETHQAEDNLSRYGSMLEDQILAAEYSFEYWIKAGNMDIAMRVADRLDRLLALRKEKNA